MKRLFDLEPNKGIIKPMSEIRIIKKNLIHVQGLPKSLAIADVLKSDDYFGQYGTITNAIINYKLNHENNKKLYSAYITYSSELEAALAVLCVDSLLINGKIIRVFFGTTKYCNNFLNNMKCPNLDKCLFLHQLASDKDIIINNDSNFSYNEHINLSKKIIQFSNFKNLNLIKTKKKKKKGVFPSIDFIFLNEEEKENYFISGNISYIKNIPDNKIYLNNFNEHSKDFKLNYFTNKLNDEFFSESNLIKNTYENSNPNINLSKKNKISGALGANSVNENNFIESNDITNIFQNSISHILRAKPFYSKLKNISLKKLEFDYFKKDLEKNGKDIYKLLDGCLDCINDLLIA